MPTSPQAYLEAEQTKPVWDRNSSPEHGLR